MAVRGGAEVVVTGLDTAQQAAWGLDSEPGITLNQTGPAILGEIVHQGPHTLKQHHIQMELKQIEGWRFKTCRSNEVCLMGKYLWRDQLASQSINGSNRKDCL